MKIKAIRYPILVLTIMVALAIACGGSDGTPTEAPPAESPTEAPPAEVPTEAPPPPTEAPPPTEEPPAEPELYRQWGFGAFASSQFGADGWAASQANGEPDTPECGDNVTAWASESYDTVETITLLYDPVYVTEVNIYESYNPDHVVQVELIAFDDDTAYTIYTQEPEAVESPCPYVLSIVMDEMTDFLVYAVRVTIDQTALNDWNEIDAVELVGMADGMAGGGEEPVGDAPPADMPIPEGVLWRVGGESGVFEGEFSALGGMDVGPDGMLYISDNIHGVYIYDLDGNEVGLLEYDGFNNPNDVKIGPDGNIYVASWGVNKVFVFDANGNYLSEFGEEGTGDGQFGSFSPEAIAVGLDSTVYVLDDNEDASEESISRVQAFSPDGTFLGLFNIEEDFFAASGMDIGPNGHLYIVGFIGGSILEYDADGNFIRKIGEEALDFTGPQSIAIDDNGYMYVSIWTEAGGVKLDPDGNFVARFGIEVDDDEVAWPEGYFYQPFGVAVTGDGSQAFLGDWAKYSFVTSFYFP